MKKVPIPLAIFAKMIQVRGLQKSYGALRVLKGIDLCVDKGEVISIVGASGAGKTTLLQIIGTLDKADSGTVTIGGQRCDQLGERHLSSFRNKHIGFVFQFHNLLPEFSALENICIPAYIAGKNQKEAEEEAMDLLDRLELTERKHHKPAELSGGEQQRIAVARALVNRPDIVLADEPSGNLDSKAADGLHKLFFELRDTFNQSFVIVTHNRELASMADRILLIKDGIIDPS